MIKLQHFFSILESYLKKLFAELLQLKHEKMSFIFGMCLSKKVKKKSGNMFYDTQIRIMSVFGILPWNVAWSYTKH